MKLKGIYTEAVLTATFLTAALALLCWIIAAVANNLTAALIGLALFWRVAFVWAMDT